VLTVESYIFVDNHSEIFHLFVAQLLSNVFVLFDLNDINYHNHVKIDQLIVSLTPNLDTSFHISIRIFDHF
jgi:hypothetical protein